MSEDYPYQNYKRLYDVIPWWLLAGSSIRDNVLLIGAFNKSELDTLSRICANLKHLGYEAINHIDRQLGSDEDFDVVIIKSLDETRPFDLDRMGDESKRRFAAFPVVVLLEDNPLHIRNITLNPLDTIRAIFFDTGFHKIQRLFSNHEITKYETLAYNGNPYESFPPQTYFTNKNTFLKTEKIKQFLLNSRFSRILYNSQIWLITRNNPLLIETIVDEMKSNESLNWESGNIVLLKILLNSGKLILSLTSRKKRLPEYIIIVPLFEHIVSQRRNERLAIEYLNRSEPLANLVVDKVFEGKVSGFEYFAMREFPGMTVEHENPALIEMTKNAIEVISKFPEANALPSGSCKKKTLADISCELIDLLILRYPFHKSMLLRIGARLRDYRNLPLISFMHGDTKIENFMIEPKTNKVIGVIDMELAEFPGIPLIDLFFLITYNYHILEHESFFEALTRIVRNNLSSIYKTAIENYCVKLGINQSQMKMCLILFFLHHFAKRILFVEESDIFRNEFEPGCRLVYQLLDELPHDLDSE